MERVERLRGKNMNEVVVVTIAYGLRLARMRPRNARSTCIVSSVPFSVSSVKLCKGTDEIERRTRSIRGHEMRWVKDRYVLLYTHRYMTYSFFLRAYSLRKASERKKNDLDRSVKYILVDLTAIFFVEKSLENGAPNDRARWIFDNLLFPRRIFLSWEKEMVTFINNSISKSSDVSSRYES